MTGENDGACMHKAHEVSKRILFVIYGKDCYGCNSHVNGCGHYNRTDVNLAEDIRGVELLISQGNSSEGAVEKWHQMRGWHRMPGG